MSEVGTTGNAVLILEDCRDIHGAATDLRLRSVAGTHDWLTPPEIITALGDFDMDPCASEHQPWRTATTQFTIRDNGLARDWHGRVYCNPPYGPHAEKFLKRCAEHGDAIALIFARTDTKAFHQWCWRRADAMLFLCGRIKFLKPGGVVCDPAASPSVLVAYGKRNAKTLRVCGINGYYIALDNEPPKSHEQMLWEAA